MVILPIAGARLIPLEPHTDPRGRFVELYRRDRMPFEVAQANRTEKRAGCVVGLHFHLKQVDLWYVTRGQIHAVLHDLREGSPTQGVTWQGELDGCEIGAEDRRLCYTSANGVPFDSLEEAMIMASVPRDRALLIPPGVAHGFAALTDCTMIYLIDRTFDPSDELGVAWNDPDIGAEWGIAEPVLSERDRGNPKRRELPPVRVP